MYFRAMTSVMPSQLADRDLFDFAALGSRYPDSPPTPSDWLVGTAGIASEYWATRPPDFAFLLGLSATFFGAPSTCGFAIFRCFVFPKNRRGR